MDELKGLLDPKSPIFWDDFFSKFFGNQLFWPNIVSLTTRYCSRSLKVTRGHFEVKYVPNDRKGAIFQIKISTTRWHQIENFIISMS